MLCINIQAKEYGVKELDLSIFNIRDFSDLTSVGLKVKVGETGAPEALTKQQIEEIISKRFSGEAYNNLMSAIDAFMEIQNRYHVNAVFAIAVAQKRIKLWSKLGSDRSINT